VVPGGTVTVEVLEGARPIREVPVQGVVSEMVGIGAYSDAASLDGLLIEGESRSGAYLAVDRARSQELYGRLKLLPGITGVALREAVIEGFDRTIAESFRRSLVTVVGFACLIAFGVIYNSARISLSERGRELASLRVLGFSRREVAYILLGELGFLVLVSLPLGFVAGYVLCVLMATGLQSDLFRVPVHVTSETYAFAA